MGDAILRDGLDSMKHERKIKSTLNKIEKYAFVFISSLILLACAGCMDNQSFVQTNQAGESVESEPQAEPQQDSLPVSDTVTLIMVGDVLLHTPINESALQEDGSYDFRHLFAQVKEDIRYCSVINPKQ